jgi:hypothetical protein
MQMKMASQLTLDLLRLSNQTRSRRMGWQALQVQMQMRLRHQM